MKALILAAGLGTRLRPITDNLPKPLVQIGLKPLLEYHLEALASVGADQICINTHYLSDQIERFTDDYCRRRPGIEIKLVFEPELLGSAGTLMANKEFFAGEKDFLVVYSDNLTNINYKKLLDFHKNKNGAASIACYIETKIESKGMVVFDKEKLIQYFKEKPKTEEVVSQYANGGIYVLSDSIFNYLDSLKNQLPLDFGKDVFPAVISGGGKIYAYEMTEFLLDIGTPESYQLAKEQVKNIKF